MKKFTWVIIIAALIGILAYFQMSKKKFPASKNSLTPSQSEQEKEAEDIEGFSVNAEESFSDHPHTPTHLEIALITGDLSPEVKDAVLKTYDRAPQAFDKNEAASLILASLLIRQDRANEYQNLAKKWETASAWPAAWVATNSDFLLMQNKKQEAIALLKANNFPGSQDIPRRVRLALLTAEYNNEYALALLNDLLTSRPQDPIPTLMLARALEKQGRITEASQELSKGIRESEDTQSLLTTALADLFRRYGQQSFALTVWDSTKHPLPPHESAKALFWNRVTASAGTQVHNQKTSLTAYNAYLANLPQGKFWDEEHFKHIPDANTFLATYQETHWLRLLDLLAQENYADALELIQNNPFRAQSWNPQLVMAVEATLNHQINGTWALSNSKDWSILDKEYGTNAWLKPEENNFISETLLAAKDNGPLNDENASLLNSKEAFSALFLAAGWEKAALDLQEGKTTSNNLPEWYVIAMTKAINQDKGPKKALRFAASQKPSPELDLQIAELLLSTGRADDAMKSLEHLRTENNDLGARAAWMSARYYISQGRLDVARQIISANRHLAETPMGQEALAVISSKQNNEQTYR